MYRKIMLILIALLMVITSTPSANSDYSDDDESPKISVSWEDGIIAETWATLYFSTDEPTICEVAWGLTNEYGNSLKENGNYSTEHFFNITGLTRDTEYFVLISVRDQNNNTGHLSFTLGTYPSGIDDSFDNKWMWIVSFVVIGLITLHVVIIKIFLSKLKRYKDKI